MERLVDWNFEVLLRLLKGTYPRSRSCIETWPSPELTSCVTAAVEAKQIALGKQKWDIEPTSKWASLFFLLIFMFSQLSPLSLIICS